MPGILAPRETGFIVKIDKPEYGPSAAAQLLRTTLRLERAAVKTQAAMREYQLQLNILQASRVARLALWEMRQGRSDENKDADPGKACGSTK